jgi:hypothetical protein
MVLLVSCSSTLPHVDENNGGEGGAAANGGHGGDSPNGGHSGSGASGADGDGGNDGDGGRSDANGGDGGGDGTGSGLRIVSGAPPRGALGVPYNLGNGRTCTPIPDTTQCLRCFPNAVIRGCVAPEYYEESFRFLAAGGTPPYSWGVDSYPIDLYTVHDGVLRCGANFTPADVGTSTVKVTVTDSAVPPHQVTEDISFIVEPAPRPTISTMPAAIGAIDVPYVNTFTTLEYGSELTWSANGSPPPGLTFYAKGVLAGTPTTVGTYSLEVTARDDQGRDSQPQAFTIEIVASGFREPFDGLDFRSRAFHSATLLGNGKVLIVGGTPNRDNVLFDPSTELFSDPDSLGNGPFSHTATLLDDGTVLLAGGIYDVSGVPTRTVQLFDPASSAFAMANELSIPRYSHTATRLNDGTVLITGGIGSDYEPLASAELYDPATGSFHLVGNMAVARMAHTATLLGNGNVLIAGGTAEREGDALDSAEIYDASARAFSSTGHLTEARSYHAAVRLPDGRVLMVGGIGDDALATSELYDAAAGVFTATGSMGTARSAPAATLLGDGSVLVTGGSSNESLLSSAELYSAATGSFRWTGSMTTPRDGLQSTLLGDGRVLVTGVRQAPASIASELYE